MTDGPGGASPFVRNLVVLIVVGVAALAWVLRYTDWFPAVGGVLALGGALSWMAFVSRLVKKERLQHLQDWADRTIFDNPRTFGRVGAAGVALGVLACFVGTLELQAAGSVPRLVTFRTQEASEIGHERVAGTRRQPFFTAWWAPRRVRVKVSGYPEATETIAPWSLTSRVVSDELLREVVVLRPDAQLLHMAPNNPMTLVVRRESPRREYRLPGYAGQTVWIGCDRDVEVPPEILESWKARLVSRSQIEKLPVWVRPIAVPEGPDGLVAGETLTIEVLSNAKSPTVFARSQATVQPVRSRRDFPQEEEIHVVPVFATPTPSPLP